MKKVVVFIISILSALYAYAQDVNPLREKSAAVSIDSLSLRLEKIQHDYDYLSCDYELYRVKTEMEDLSQNISIKANGVIINIYHSRYDRALYTAYSENYDAFCVYYDALKKRVEQVKEMVMHKIVSSNFTDAEIGLIHTCFDSIDNTAAVVGSSLNLLDVAIRTYKNNR